jgi:hypothetical protein
VRISGSAAATRRPSLPCARARSSSISAAFRILKPGGRIAIADVVNTAPLPAELASDASLLCACLAGAATTRQIEDWLAAAGFIDISIAIKPGSRGLIESWAPGRGIEDYAASATIEARKPALAGS